MTVCIFNYPFVGLLKHRELKCVGFSMVKVVFKGNERIEVFEITLN